MTVPRAWHVDPDPALADLRALASDGMRGRETGTEEGERARSYIIARLHEAGVAPLGAGYERPFFWVQLDGTKRHGVNLLAHVAGTQHPDRYLLLSAHYDHLGYQGAGAKGSQIMSGADDNASGVASLLAVARHLMAHPPAVSVLLAFFDGEEAELRGSKYFTMHPPVPLERIRANVNVDMIGRSSDGALRAAGTRHAPWIREAIESALGDDPPVPVKFGHDRFGWVPWLDYDWTEASDHFAFHEAGIPWVYIGTSNDAETHATADDFGSIDQEFFVAATELVIRATEALGAHLAG